MAWYGDPDGLHEQAARLSSAACRVRDRAWEVRSTAATARWRGVAADAFHASVRRESTLLERAADELDDAAAALHRHADAVRHELDRLLAVERAGERLLSGGIAALSGLLP